MTKEAVENLWAIASQGERSDQLAEKESVLFGEDKTKIIELNSKLGNGPKTSGM